MKTTKKLSLMKYALCIVLVVGINSCTDDDEVFQPVDSSAIKTIAEILNDTPEVTTLNGELSKFGLDETLANNATFTVFAPNNSAFSSTDMSTMTDSELENLIMNHVLSTTTADLSSNLITGYRTTMATGPEGTNLSLFVNKEGGVTLNGNINPVTGMFDLGATNGVVHVVDGLLTLPKITNHIASNPDFSILMSALERVSLVDTLQTSGPFTVMAPTNTSFEVLLTQLNDAFGWSTLEEIPEDVLTDVLTYHVISEINAVSASIDGETLTTVQGETFTANGTTIDDASYTDAGISIADIQGINGVIHSVDKVLLPNTVFQQVLSETLDLPSRLKDKGYNAFAEAIELAGLSDLITQEQLTLFTPTDAAFEVLFLQIDNFDGLADFDTPEEIATLKSLLEYHFLDGISMSNQFTNGVIETILLEELTVAADNGVSLTPTRGNAPVAQVSIADVGASNGVIHEIDNVLIPESLAVALGYPQPIVGGTPEYGFQLYDDALADGMWNGGWATQDPLNTDPVKSGVYSYSVLYPNGDEGWQVGGADIPDVNVYSFFNFSAYSENGTTLGVVLNEQWGSQFNVDIPAGEWTEIAIPVSAIANGTTAFNQVVIRGTLGNPGEVVYLDEIGFDVTYVAGPPALEFALFTDELADGMWNGGWATQDGTNTDPVREGIYSYSAVFPGDGFEGWQVGGAAIADVNEYDFFVASIYSENGTTVGVILNEQWGNQVDVDIPAGEWADISIPVSSLANGTTAFNQVVIRGTVGIPGETIYIDNVGFN